MICCRVKCQELFNPVLDCILQANSNLLLRMYRYIQGIRIILCSSAAIKLNDYYYYYYYYSTIPVSARSKAWVCGCLLARITVSNPAGGWLSASYECVCC